MKIDIEFGANKLVKCNFDGFTVASDQSVNNGGEGAYPEPFDYFLASTVLCAGIYVRNYLETRKLDSSNIKITQENTRDPENKYLHTFKLNIIVPEDLEERHKKGIMRAAQLCSVKKAIAAAPNFEINVMNESDL